MHNDIQLFEKKKKISTLKSDTGNTGGQGRLSFHPSDSIIIFLSKKMKKKWRL